MENEVKYYRKKPIIIKAFQYLGDYEFNLPDWISDKIVMLTEGTGGIIRTLEGNMFFQYGDYIAQGIHGEVYPIKQDIFEESYEEVENEINN